MSRRYITTPIYYVNDRPHVGHCYSTLIADCLARFARLAGHEVFFLTGTDEHAEKVVSSAKAHDMTPLQWADRNAAEFEAAFKLMGFSNDDFIRTTESRHTEKVTRYIQQLMDSGDIALGEYVGWYDPSQEEYLTETEAKKHDYQSPVTGRPLEKRTEQNYFFKLSEYQDRLLEHIESNPSFIQPEARRNEVLGRIKDGLNDVPVSRAVKEGEPAWGISMPGDPGHRVYVWIDALFNYLSTVDTDGRRAFWSKDDDLRITHILAKDILWFHAVIWPCLLMALDERIPDTVYAHAFWVREGRKMSKSLGNFLDLDTLRAYVEWDAFGEFGLDALRWYLLTQGPLGPTDADFAHANFVSVYNADLANGIGNAASRVANMIAKYFDGVVPEPPKLQDDSITRGTSFDSSRTPAQGGRSSSPRLMATIWPVIFKSRDTIGSTMRSSAVHDDVPESVREYVQNSSTAFNYELLMAKQLVNGIDLYISETRPFSIAKDDPKDVRVSAILYECAEAIRIAAVLLSPAMPAAMSELLKRFGQPAPEADGTFRDAAGNVVPLETLCQWGGLKPGTKIVKGDPLFPRVDADAEPPVAVPAGG